MYCKSNQREEITKKYTHLLLTPSPLTTVHLRQPSFLAASERPLIVEARQVEPGRWGGG
jgi:hypothetical protein